MAERATIARPYAKAVFETALPARAFAQWSSGLGAAAEIVVDPRVTELIKNPELPPADIAEFIIGVAVGFLLLYSNPFLSLFNGK